MNLRKLILYDLLMGLLCATFAYLFAWCLHDTLSEKCLTLLTGLISFSTTVAACLTVNRFIFLRESINKLDEQFRQDNVSADSSDLEKRLSKAEEKLANLSYHFQIDSDSCKRQLTDMNNRLCELTTIICLLSANVGNLFKKQWDLESREHTDESGTVVS